MDGLNLSHAGLLADPSAMTNTDWSHRAETTSKLYAEATNQLMPPVDVGKRHTMGDLFCGVGGYPCQPFSQMGKRFGRRDPRDTLIYPTVDIVAAIDPDAVVLENSDGFANACRHKGDVRQDRAPNRHPGHAHRRGPGR